MRVHAVVLNWKDTPRTTRCVQSLVEIDGIDRIIVVDNESDGTLERSLPAGAAEVIPVVENRGFAGGVNLGLAESLRSGADAVLVINNDATLSADAFAELRKALEADDRLGLVAPSISIPHGDVMRSSGYVNALAGTTDHRPRPGREPDFVTWACVLVRADALERVGLLDERFFMYWEDVDFCLRLREAGVAFSEIESARASHEVSANRSVHSVAIKAYHTWSAGVFADKHGGMWRIGRVAWLTTSAGANLLRGRKQALKGLRAGIALGREAATPAWRSRLRAQRFAVVGDDQR